MCLICIDFPCFTYYFSSGFIAEEAAQVDPMFAFYDAASLPEGLDWFAILTYVVAELQKVRAELNALRSATL